MNGCLCAEAMELQACDTSRPEAGCSGLPSRITVRRRVFMNRIRLLGGAICLLGLITSAANAQTSPDSTLSRLQGNWLATTYEGANHWWARYGEPVNAAQLTAHSAAAAAQSTPVPLYGPGYVYRPGSCDCPPPCIWDLWTGYVQNPKRCHPGCGWLHGKSGCCGAEGAAGCSSADCRSFCLTQRIRDVLGHCHACEAGCGHGPACGCTVPTTPAAPAATAAAAP